MIFLLFKRKTLVWSIFRAAQYTARKPNECNIYELLLLKYYLLTLIVLFTVETDRRNRERRYHGAVCTSARYDKIGLPVFHVNCPRRLEKHSPCCVSFKGMRGAKSLRGGFDGLVTRFLHFSGNTDVLLRDEDATDTRIEQLERDEGGFTFQKTLTAGYTNNHPGFNF